MIPLLAEISFANSGWLWATLLAAAVLVPLTWLALRPAGPQSGARAVGLGLRTLGIGLLLLCLLDPQWVSPRPKKGANVIALLVDNSQSLQIADAGQTDSRGQKIRTELTAPDVKWLVEIADDFQVRPYVFDRDLRRVRDFSELDFQGTSTALGSALKQLRERFATAPGQSAAPLAGILLFTDGDATDLPNGLTDTGGLPPVYPVIIGSADGLRDVSIAHADVRQTAFDDAPVSLTVAVAGTGLVGHDVAVSVRPLDPTIATSTPADKIPPVQTVRLTSDRDPVEVKFDWHPAGSGVQFFQTSAALQGDPVVTEATLLNNQRAVMVDRGRPIYRILYVSGEPNWEFKFLNRALADDPQLQLPALIRVAPREPKFTYIGHAAGSSNPLFEGTDVKEDTQRYDQPVFEVVNGRDSMELAAGFPRNAAELFAYDAVILDKVEAAMFSTDQLALLRRFTAERGGGLLMLGGVDSLEDGGYANTPLAAVLPVYLDRKVAPPKGDLTWSLTREGWLEPWTRIRPTEADERTRQSSMPQFKVSNAIKSIKPGATVLAEVTDQAGSKYPALIAQHYGAGRVAAVAVGDLWRWGMQGADAHADLDRFWRQLARWLVTDVPAQVELRVEPAAEEAGGVSLRVSVRDKEYKPLDLASLHLTVKRVGGPEIAPATPGATAEADATAAKPAATFTQITLPAEPVVDAPGQFAATFAPREAGAYLAEVEVTDRAGEIIGRSQAGWVNDPAADEFSSLAPNRALLEELARRTGGEVIPWADLGTLAKKFAHMPAPITENFEEPLWQQGWVFLAVLTCFLSEWAWRRWKGLP